MGIRKWRIKPVLSARTPPSAEVAVHSGTCPVCHVFIAKNHSWVRRLPRPIEPQVEWRGDIPVSSVTGQIYHTNRDRFLRMHPRWNVHEYCWMNAARVLDGMLPSQ